MPPRERAATLFETGWFLPALGLLALASISASLGPDVLLQVLVGALLIGAVSFRPQWGVAVILTLLLVQYGPRRFDRTGIAWITGLIPAGSGLVTVNNVMGVFLALLLVYHVYRDGDWSFLKNQQVRLVGLIAATLILSAFINGVDYGQYIALGLRLTEQNPMRAMGSRALFLVLFVAFVRRPRDLRTMVWIFIGLAVVTAWSGSQAALGSRVDIPQAADYRAGGLGALIETAGNPNRLALVATMALIFLWEYSQSLVRWRWRWLLSAPMLLLVVTVILTASRGGTIGLAAAVLALFVRRRPTAGRFVYSMLVVLVGAVLVSQIVPAPNIERLSNLPGISDDPTGEGAGSLQRRQYTYSVAFDIWARKPIFGVGLGNWSLIRFTTDPLRSGAVPHNSYLKALCEGGAVTLTLYLWLFVLTLRRLAALERDPDVMERARRDNADWLISAASVSLLSFLVFSLFADLWELIFFYFVIAIAATLIQLYGSESSSAAA